MTTFAPTKCALLERGEHVTLYGYEPFDTKEGLLRSVPCYDARRRPLTTTQWCKEATAHFIARGYAPATGWGLAVLLDERMTTALYWLYDETRTHKSKKKQDVI